MSFDLKFHIHRLLRAEPFFSTFSRRLEKRVDNTIPTAAIMYDRDSMRFTLLYNEEFFESLPDGHKIGVIKHEFYHLILKHVTDRLPFDPQENPELVSTWNIAADLAINGYIYKELPKIACVPTRGPFKDYSAGLTAEVYYELLREDKKNQKGAYKKNSKGQAPAIQTLDDHSAWVSNSTDGDKDVLSESLGKEELTDITRASIEAADKSVCGWGDMPHHIRRKIRKLASPTVDPETVLRYFVRTSRRSAKISTIRRINRRYPFIHPGSRRKTVANIAISIDQSASVSDEMGRIFFSFLDKFATIATFTVVPFDSDVAENEVYIWKKGERREWERVLDGGTNFNAPTKWVNERCFDGHIVLTDMQASKPIASKCQRLWITDSQNKNANWFPTKEKVLALDY